MKKDNQEIRHALFGTSISNWIRLLIENGGIDLDFLPRALFITFFTLVTLPSRILSKLLYGSRIAKTRIKNPPIFIIGHWRSGTTFLHELISQDPLLSHVSLWHTMVPYSFLVLENFKTLMASFLPATRPMDMIKVDIDGPYEEEAGLAVLGRWSFFHCIYFPRNAKRLYNQSVLFEGLNAREVKRWKRNYLWFLKEVTYSNKGQKLVLKNPANTARIDTLLEIFPEACFIHIYRNPYTVYFSTKHMRTRVLGQFALQRTTTEELDSLVIDNYIRMMKSFFKQKDQISKERLVEIRYEDLVEDPMGQVQKIYTELGLPGLEAAKFAMKKYLDEQAGYVTNVYTFDEAAIHRIEKNWGFVIKRWGYKPPELESIKVKK